FINGMIAGVFSYRSRVPSFDVNTKFDSSFGEIANLTRVAVLSDWIDTTVIGRFDLVLDMQKQPTTGGANITLNRSGSSVQVTNYSPSSGVQVYYTADISSLNSIKIYGTETKDSLTIEGPIGVPISFDGRNESNEDIDPDTLIVRGSNANDTMIATNSSVTS